MEKVFSRQNIVDLCLGATVLGTGGGGSPELGMELLNGIYDVGKEIKMIAVDDVPDDAIVVFPAGVGSIAETEEKSRYDEQLKKTIMTDESPLRHALDMMESTIGQKVYGAVAIELGGYNTALAAFLGALAGIPFVDADTIGRAKPESEMQCLGLHQVPITPIVLADVWGNTVVVSQVESYRSAEKIARAMAVIGGGTTAVRCPMTGKRLKETILPGTVSKALRVGQALREAQEQNTDPVEAVIEASEGIKLFEGTVSSYQWEDRGGFLWGDIFIRGEKHYHGQKLRVWLKNENEISWLDGKPYVMTPDSLCIIDAASGEPITNTNMREGLQLVVFGIPAPPIFRTPEGLALVGPAHFEFDLPYVPIEDLVS
ncbi:hypothetical protein CSA56_18440 [candidate division KSB3 bacterium]|uniref:DUF917 domain-containing protein n=1 Tax=candidate division KSB3 bacterium TaxID=2044937 RepID=A0A2G6K6X2_9BACT|nr:MAG: hypothetical protein CSA56_18440 [candidate division KSB3 bacterium]